MRSKDPRNIMKHEVIDVVMDTYNRLDCLRRSVESVLANTTQGTYRLHVIDDASNNGPNGTNGNAPYLREMYRKGYLASIVIRKERKGIPANWNAVPIIGKSSVVVYTNGDVICPKLPKWDWVIWGLGAMGKYPDVGMISLNSPMCTAKRTLKILGRRRGLILADRVPSFFLFVRRDLMRKIHIPDVGGKLCKIPVIPTFAKIDRIWSRAAGAHGYKVGYLQKIYCRHIGIHSVRKRNNLSKFSIEPINPFTLEPPRRYRGW